MIVRQATKKDHEAIVQFQLAMAHETEGIELHQPTVIKGVEAVLNNGDKGHYYVTEVDGEVVGSLLTTFEWSDWRNGTILWIQSVYVKPEFRRKGVYRKMYSYLKDKVSKADNLNGIRLYADKTNLPAQKTYETLGMNQDHYVMFEWLK
ncbi:GNAT family N-acetyltransferase [Draconibacterium sp. IB214405]|uniref:GNAT family N-acetyltransferase n=1 Tax=Draconibacterium sp. IB214405 TaxID=3097352 RepID=UPI002A0DFBD3|nr:GNAT family N-acetyltransferase [Draconibacterium sp. IB214405]MDX8338571.1 GNAT family N-acetyltransferase [Draconibacterium sp. IB214405]